MKTNCKLYALMKDTIKLWLKDNNIKMSKDQYNDLLIRLLKAEQDLSNKFSCKQTNKIPLEQC